MLSSKWGLQPGQAPPSTGVAGRLSSTTRTGPGPWSSPVPSVMLDGFLCFELSLCPSREALWQLLCSVAAWGWVGPQWNLRLQCPAVGSRGGYAPFRGSTFPPALGSPCSVPAPAGRPWTGRPAESPHHTQGQATPTQRPRFQKTSSCTLDGPGLCGANAHQAWGPRSPA